jgi:hypothetical protein
VPVALAASGQQNRQFGGSPRPSEFVVRLAAQSVSGVGNNLGVHRAGLSAETWSLAYLLL